jgi:hypothetical protein
MARKPSSFPRWFVCLFLCSLLATGLLGCGGSEHRFNNNPERNLISISVTPSTQTLNTTGQTLQLIATGNYDQNPLSQDLTSSVQWASSLPSVATVGPGGLVTAVATGTSTVTANLAGFVGTATITVNALGAQHTLTSITVIPAQQITQVIGETAQYIAIGNYDTSPTSEDLTNQVTWVSSDVRVATINPSGLATAIGSVDGGVTTITAISPPSSGVAVTGTATMTVTSNGTNQLPSLTVYEFGQGTGNVVSSPGGLNCTSGNDAGCTGHFVLNSIVTLTAAPANGSKFGGFSANCIPVADSCTAKESNVSSCTCQLPMTDNATVGAIFNPGP